MKNIQHTFLIAIGLLIANLSYSNDDLNIKKIYVSNSGIKDANFDTEDFYKHNKEVKTKIKEAFDDYHDKQNILVAYSFHKYEDPTITIHSDIEIDTEETERIIQLLREVDPINSEIVDYHMLYKIKVDGGNGKKVVYTPHYDDPYELIQIEIEEADFSEKHDMIKKWAINEAIPVCVALLLEVDKDFEGIQDYARLIHDTNFNKEQDIIELTEENQDFWWACIEMQQWNMLVQSLKVFMHISQGEFDIARVYQNMIYIFSNEETVADYFMNQLNDKLDAFYKDLDEQIEEGIEHHDDEEYEEAIDIYTEILKEYPHSAWANYELYLSKQQQKVEEELIEQGDNSNWETAKIEVYRCNPLYGLDVTASNGEEAYLMFRRLEISTVYDGDDFVANVTNYADIALDLKVYGFAGLLYYNILAHVKEKLVKRKNLIYYWLYCLEKLGADGIKNVFKGKHDKEFAKVEKERAKAMKKSPIYKAFKKSDSSIDLN